jgi:hypothetical protein
MKPTAWLALVVGLSLAAPPTPGAAPSRSAPAPVNGRTPAGSTTTPCSTHSSPYGVLMVCPGTSPAGGRVTVSAQGCRGASIVFLGPLDYIGSGGAGDPLPRTVEDKPGQTWTISFRIPVDYPAGGNLGGTVAVSAAGRYQFGSYPANECSAPFALRAPAGTSTVIYHPFTGQALNRGVHVVARLSGTCLENPSPVELRLYYRCFTTPTKGAGNRSFVFDPCFARPGGSRHLPSQYICPEDPATGEVITLRATSVRVAAGGRPPSGGEGRPQPSPAPWAIQLLDGQVCELVAAAWGGLGPYGCQDNLPPAGHAVGAGPGAGVGAGTRVADCHRPDSARAYWTVACQVEETGASPFRPTSVVRAWF